MCTGPAHNVATGCVLTPARRVALLAEFARLLPDCPIHGAQGGLHVMLDLPEGVNGKEVCLEAQRRDLRLCDVSYMLAQPDPDDNRLLVQAIRHVQNQSGGTD